MKPVQLYVGQLISAFIKSNHPLSAVPLVESVVQGYRRELRILEVKLRLLWLDDEYLQALRHEYNPAWLVPQIVLGFESHVLFLLEHQ